MIKSVNWLAENLLTENLIVLDASLTNVKERTEQIPGARYFDLKKDFSDTSSPFPNTMPSEAQFQTSARNLGINKRSTLIIYDNVGIYNAPRAWFMFRSMGHKEVYVLDGGLPEWILQGQPVEEITNKPIKTGNFEANYDASVLKSTDQVEKNIEEQRFTVVDARAAGRFDGTSPEPRPDLQSGCIPHSINIPYTQVLKDGKFKSKDELKEILRIDQPAIFSCGSGITACILLLAAEIAGLTIKKTVYDGSWTEWAMVHNLYTEK